MSRLTSRLMLLVLALLGLSVSVFAQAPTGILEGTIHDASGAVVPNATVTITNKATGIARTATTNTAGIYSAPALPAGDYDIKVEAAGFRTQTSTATLPVGGDITVNATLQVGAAQEVVNVEAAASQINYENHEVQGVIEHSEVEDLPLNGRNYAQLASLEPGVTIATGTPAQFNTLFTVSVLGAGTRTLFTVDGGSVADNIDVGSGQSSVNFSQEVIQEFQLSTVNFDISTGVAAGGAINMVTRSGTNDFHGSGYFFYRDHNMAAYPLLERNPADLNPYFVRKNPGMSIGGPVKKDRTFFFFAYEHTYQDQALNVGAAEPSLQPLVLATYQAPYDANLYNFRIDHRINAQNSLFVRYSHDGNSGFGPAITTDSDPSNWPNNINWADQSIIGLTSTITPTIVNDLRFQYQYWSNHNVPATAGECSAPCAAGVLPTINAILPTSLAAGPNGNSPQARNTRRFEEVETLTWQKGSHRLRFGGDADRAISAGLWGFCSICAYAASPEYITGLFEPAYGAATFNALFPTLPSVITNDTQLLNLPVVNPSASIFEGIGVGNDSTPAPYNRGANEPESQYRAYFGDTWKVKSNFTLNYGLGWNAQTGWYGVGYNFPQFLAPIFPGSNLGPTANNLAEMQPLFGFAWSPFKNNKTVIRGGGGIYWDSTPGYYKLREAPVLGPPGNGRSTVSASEFTIPAGLPTPIVDLNTGKTLTPGSPLPLLPQFTNLTVGEFVQIVNAELPVIQAQLAPSNPVTSGSYPVSGIDINKSGVEIYPPDHFPLARSYQTSLGVQQALGHDMIFTADWARRQGENVSLGEVDLNHFNLYNSSFQQTPVIPICTAAQVGVVGQECSTGAITVWTDEGRAVYEGLLVKVQKRLSHRYSYLLSYALQSLRSDTAIYNEVNWESAYGPGLSRQNLNISGVLNLPWGFQLSLNSSIISRAPVTANIGSNPLPGVDLSGSQPLPGLPIGCLNYGCGKSQLASAVAFYDSTYAGTKDASGGTFPYVVLPQNYALSSPTLSQDMRLTKTFTYKERYKLALMAEMFNVLNVANLIGQSYTLDTRSANPATQTYAFGQPTNRVAQTFGSGGPRALQVAARITF